MGKSGSQDSKGAPVGQAARLEAEIEAARNQLAVTIDQIAGRVAPQAVAAQAKSKARGIVVNADGSLKKDRVIKIAAVAGLVLVIGAWRRYR